MDNALLIDIKVVLNDSNVSHPVVVDLGKFIKFNSEMNRQLNKLEGSWRHTSTPLSLVSERLLINEDAV